MEGFGSVPHINKQLTIYIPASVHRNLATVSFLTKFCPIFFEQLCDFEVFPRHYLFLTQFRSVFDQKMAPFLPNVQSFKIDPFLGQFDQMDPLTRKMADFLPKMAKLALFPYDFRVRNDEKVANQGYNLGGTPIFGLCLSPPLALWGGG